MKKKLIPMMLLAGGCLFARTNFSIGVGVGTPAYIAPPVAAAVRPPCPGPGYTWVDGYQTPGGPWVAGYWAAPAFRTAPYARAWHRDDHRFVDRGHFDRERGFRR